MKGVAIYLFIFIGPIAWASHTDFKGGDTVYVWANQGLLLRKDPNFSSKVIAKLNYGERVVVEERTQSNADFEIAEQRQINGKVIPSITLKGFFVKVTFNDSVGFLFDGFLSTLPPMNANEQLKAYFQRVFGGIQVLKEIKNENSDYSFQMCSFSKGIFFQEESGRENSWDHFYLIPNISLQEGYLLINRLTSFEMNYKRELKLGTEALENCPISFNDTAIMLQIDLFDVTEIQKRNNFVIITRGGGN